MPKVVLLLSDKRSGSTMLQDELCKHPDIRHVDYTPHTYFETHHWLKGAVLLGLPPETFSGGQIYPGYGSPANARAYMQDCISKNVPDFQIPTTDRDLVFKGWDALCHQFSTPVFFEKSPQVLANWASLSLILEWMATTDMDVRVIGLTRNPLSVQYSAQQLFKSKAERRQYGWLEIQKNLLAFRAMVPEDKFKHVKYEDIITQAPQTFAAICEFIGVPANQSVGQAVHARSMTKWKDDPDFTLQLDEPVKQIAQRLGYTDEELDNPTKPKPQSRHQVENPISARMLSIYPRFINRFAKPLLMRLGLFDVITNARKRFTR